MGGFGPLAASLGFFLRGQQQGEQAQGLQREQFDLEKAKLGLLQRQASLAGKQLVQMPDGSLQVVDLATATPGSTIGTGVDYGKRLQSMVDTGSLPEGLKGLAQSAIKSDDKGYQQQLYESALKLVGSPTFEKTNLSASEKRQAISEALQTNVPPALRPLLQRAISPDASPALVDAAYKELMPAFGSSLYAPHIFPTTATDPTTGITTTTPYRSEGREGAASPVMTGAAPSGAAPSTDTGPPGAPAPGMRPLTSEKPIPAKDLDLVRTVQGLLPQLGDLRNKLQAIGPERWNRNLVARNLAYARQKYGKVAASSEDPEVSKLTSKLIQIESSANAALAASAGTRAIGFIKLSEGHIPSGRGDYDYNMNSIDTLLDPNGPYLPTLNFYKLNPVSPYGSGGGSSKTGDIPPGFAPIPGVSGFMYNPSTGKTIQLRVVP